jgi:hypothetical protein
MQISRSDINVNICKIIRERCSDIEGQSIFSDINVKISLIFYCEMKYKWGKESYIDKCTRKKRMGIIWLKPGIWKLRGIRRGFEKRRCPLYLELKCSETKKVEGRMCKQQLAEYKRGLSIYENN